MLQCVVVPVLLHVCLSSGQTVPERPTQKELYDKYFAVLYPEQPSRRVNARTNLPELPTITFYDATPSGAGRELSVVYSDSVGAAQQQDGDYAVKLSRIAQRDGRQYAASTFDVTKFLPGVEYPGNLMQMDARLNVVQLPGAVEGVHLNVWGTLSGTGSISSASDIVFAFRDGKFVPVLQLENTSRFSRVGAASVAGKDTELFISLNPIAGSEICSRATVWERNVGGQTTNAKVECYQWTDGRYTATAQSRSPELADKSAWLQLDRSRSIPTVRR